MHKIVKFLNLNIYVMVPAPPLKFHLPPNGCATRAETQCDIADIFKKLYVLTTIGAPLIFFKNEYVMNISNLGVI